MRKPFDEASFAQIGGRMDRRVNFFSPTEARDAAGGSTLSWVNVGRFSARVLSNQGSELQQASQKISLAPTEMRIRYYAPITARWRVFFDANIYEVISPPSEVGRKQYLDLACRALNPDDATMLGVGVQSFSVALNQGDTSATVTFPLAFAGAPAGIYPSIVAPGGGYVLDCSMRAGSLTTTGCIVDFGADIPATGYSLFVIAIL